MILKLGNLTLLVVAIVYGCLLVTQRYKARLHYMQLQELENKEYEYNQEYTKLQLELGTYSSGLVLQDLAHSKLGLVAPDSKHIIGVK